MAHSYTADVTWTRDEAVFTDNRYSRGHVWRFDGGVTVPASSAPSSVRPPYSKVDAVDPEEALVAALSSCHMLFFLAFAAAQGFRVDHYDDKAEGVMTKNAKGKLFVSTVTLRPAVTFSGDKLPDRAAIDHLHHRSHEECFLANSVLAEIVIEASDPILA
ncbi:OsmC family protein [Phreatobacter stygius]|uniref:OsmC family peroxiredoxin n=1 Tax=Phreatobacter stygius TaxID=1940610 RepID=A0A4D7BAX7_9HYPH|nr:OsmC family protein [Phreatobacter stygius]QCI66626.1 OsmC family peroxiredoxin [Phreatobacter stygius]